MERLIDDTTFVVTDTETTGLRPGPHRVIEIGAVKVVGGRITDSFTRLVNPGSSVPRQITRLTGITTQMVSAAPPIEKVLPAYLDFLGDGVFVGHNAAFDRKFLQFELRRSGIDFRIGKALCTRRLALRILHALPSRSLSSLMHHYGIVAARRHRALDDARATAEVLLRLLASLRTETGMDALDDLLRFQNSRHEQHRTIPPNVRRIRSDLLTMLPDVPGVYLFKGSNSELLYVGKARSIRSRVRSYFVGIDTHPMRIRQLVKLVRDIDYIPTPTEASALILESRLIKKERPRFNRAEVRYKNLPFIRIAAGESEPRVSWSFEIHPDGADYFGPLKNRHEAETFVEIVRRFPEFSVTGFEAICRTLEDEMQDAADQLDFEQAGRLRDEIAFLRDFASRPYRAGFSILDHNAVWIEQPENGLESTILIIRRGRLAADTVVPLPVSDESLAGLRIGIEQSFGTDDSFSEPYRRKEIDEIRILASWIYRLRDRLDVVPVEPGETTSDVFEHVKGALSSLQ